MNGDQIGAAVFAAAAVLYLWRYEGPLLAELNPLWRRLLIGGGSLAIILSLLHYLGKL